MAIPRKTTNKALPVSQPLREAAIRESLLGYETRPQPNYVPILVILLIIASFFLGVASTRLGFIPEGAPTTSETTTETGNGPTPVAGPAKIALSDKILGQKGAKVEVVEFSDFQCPFCRRYFNETLPQIKKDYIDTGEIVYSYRHFPLDFHPAAQVSAEASECANDQGKFWEFHDKVFEEQTKKGEGTIQYTEEDIITWAGQAGINTAALKTCIDSGKHKEKVQKDTAEGQTAGVSGTPGFFVNGNILIGAQPYSVFKDLIEKELTKNK